ncbi:MAG: hypothetical protein K2X27_20305 [Candidatus Obscuribacterales bacterium]|nr:hypothetical protein [Candidatus Obscuribacterales bacterium]
MPQAIVLVHAIGAELSENASIPTLIRNNGHKVHDICFADSHKGSQRLSFNELAGRLENSLAELENSGLDISQSAIIGYSTGAILARRWLLNRSQSGKSLPSHFISLAGPQHGSSLAQLGNTIRSKVFPEFAADCFHERALLEELDYASEFLWTLNEEWLKAAHNNQLATYIFSMVGDDHSDLKFQLFWQTKENGSDAATRISSANLNYRIMSVDLGAAETTLRALELPWRTPHLVIPGVSHFGEKGILNAGNHTADTVFRNISKALSVSTREDYEALASIWNQLTEDWGNAKPSHNCSTIIFNLENLAQTGHNDCLILLHDDSRNAHAISNAIEKHQPLQNAELKSRYSFYLNFPRFQSFPEHHISIEHKQRHELMHYELHFEENKIPLLRANEFTYLKIRLINEESN